MIFSNTNEKMLKPIYLRLVLRKFYVFPTDVQDEQLIYPPYPN